nr:MarR family transcriptional regulator [Allosalinactinospora lopnorensis]
MPARVLAFLLVTESGSLTARQLGERLSASPAAISKAVRYLETFSLVRRDRIPGNRRETYRFAGDWSAVFARREALFAPWENEAREGVRIVGADTSAGARLAEMSHFFQLVRGTIRRVRRHRVRRSSPAPGR